MKKTDFYLLMDKVLDLAPGTIKGNESLSGLSAWDSLAVVGFIAALDKHFHVNVPAKQVVEAQSIDDLAKLTGQDLSQ
jgi:acyl carrier protein